MEIPLEVGDGIKDLKLQTYCHTNNAFDYCDKNVQIQSVPPSPFGKASYDYPMEYPLPRVAIRVTRAVKRYSKKGPYVLNNFSMNVQQGNIYSLLGSSGCGKTTVLTCILGMRQLSSGVISIFGSKPGTAESGVPGKRIGFMPQEISLYKDFSIEETLQFYGSLYSMTKADVKTRKDFLMGFLNLPDETQRVGSLSSGQQRRVSMAVALIHSPQILILDEPTVGVDAMLRINIWNHLVELVAAKKTTRLQRFKGYNQQAWYLNLLSHIEEARQSNMIGLMRGGRLLEENSPEYLMAKYNATMLEDVVLKLCQNDKFADKHGNSESSFELQTASNDFQRNRKPSITQRIERLAKSDQISNSLNRIKVLTIKNVYTMARNSLLVLFMILVPSVLVTLLCLGIGSDPKGLHVGVVNYDAKCFYQSSLNETDLDGCRIESLSCTYLKHLPPDVIILDEFATEDEARDAVLDGKKWGFISFPEGYSDSAYVRASSGKSIDNDTLEGSFISYRLDMSNKQIAATIIHLLDMAYANFMIELSENCGFNAMLALSPVRGQKPIYGTAGTDFREFIAPSILIGFLFFFPLCSSSMQYIKDKKQGTLERVEVAGVQTFEIMLAFLITEGVILLIQSGLSLLIITAIFDIQIQGSEFLALSLTISIGLCGVAMGFVVASICSEEHEAVMLSMSAFFPNVLLSGLIWPIHGMPKPLQYVSYLLPCRWVAESFRSVISRGWDITHYHVWIGFVAVYAWICLYSLVTICIHKIVLKRK